jgi:hypothetical protein
MSAKSGLRPYVNRYLLVLAISVVFTAGFNEASYILQKDKYDRAPKTIQLVIPAGTAQKVTAGEPVPSIPAEMVFVLGDVLEVKNEDSVSHQLGPIWVPPGTTGSLKMELASKLAYHCSFSTSRYLNLDVRLPTTAGDRLVALAIAAPTLSVLLFVYGILAYPIRQKAEVAVEKPAGEGV